MREKGYAHVCPGMLRDGHDTPELTALCAAEISLVKEEPLSSLTKWWVLRRSLAVS